MANSFVRYTGNGSTTAYAIPFTYIDSAHLACTVNGVSASFTLNSAGTQATLSSVPANGSAIEFRRTSSQTTRLTDYVSGAVLTESALDTDSTQGFFMSQEAVETMPTFNGVLAQKELKTLQIQQVTKMQLQKAM